MRAQEIDDDPGCHAEANRGDTWRAILCFRRAIEAEPRFAAAHVNLAVAFERMGEDRKARQHWRRYLEVERTGEWAAAARRQLAPSRGISVGTGKL